MNTIAITDLQKSPKKSLEKAPFSYILANNQRRGMILNVDMMNFLEKKGWIDEYEDSVLLRKFSKQNKEVQDIIKTGDYSNTLSFDEL